MYQISLEASGGPSRPGSTDRYSGPARDFYQEGLRPPTGPIRPEDGQPGRQVLEMEPIGTGAGTVIGGLIWIT